MRTFEKPAGPGALDDRVPRNVPGIVIADGGAACRVQPEGPRLRAFIYGEEQPAAPTLPFGRWKT